MVYKGRTSQTLPFIHSHNFPACGKAQLEKQQRAEGDGFGQVNPWQSQKEAAGNPMFRPLVLATQRS